MCWSNSNSGNRCKNWNFRVCKLLLELDSGEFCDLNRDISKRALLDTVVLPLISQQCVEQPLMMLTETAHVQKLA